LAIFKQVGNMPKWKQALQSRDSIGEITSADISTKFASIPTL